MTCTGGASIIDSMLAVRESECDTPDVLNVYPDAMVQTVEGSPFRVIDQQLEDIGPLPYSGPANQSSFVRRRADQMCVITYTGTSVNHLVAEKRTLTGNDAWAGRTHPGDLCRGLWRGPGAAQCEHGRRRLHRARHRSGAARLGPRRARHERARRGPSACTASRDMRDAPSADAHGARRGQARERLEHAVALRPHLHSLGAARRVEVSPRRREPRRVAGPHHAAQLACAIRRSTPCPSFGLTSSSETPTLLQRVFPLMATDPMEAQAALAYLLIANGISVTVTIGPSLSPNVGGQQIVDSPPLAFDFSHTLHRGAQAIMWHRMLSVADRLIESVRKRPNISDGQELLGPLADVFRQRLRSQRAVAPTVAREFGTGPSHQQRLPDRLAAAASGNSVLRRRRPEHHAHLRVRPHQRPRRSRAQHEREAELFAGIVQRSVSRRRARVCPTWRALRRA
jgi:hypothetical protein